MVHVHDHRRAALALALALAATIGGFLAAPRAATASPRPDEPSVTVAPGWTFDGMGHLHPAALVTVEGVPGCVSNRLVDPGDGRVVASVGGEQVVPSAGVAPDSGLAPPDSIVFHAPPETIVAALAWPGLGVTTTITISCRTADGSEIEVVSTTYAMPAIVPPYSVPVPAESGEFLVLYHEALDLGRGHPTVDPASIEARIDGTVTELTLVQAGGGEAVLAATVPGGAAPGLHIVEIGDGDRSASFPIITGHGAEPVGPPPPPPLDEGSGPDGIDVDGEAGGANDPDRVVATAGPWPSADRPWLEGLAVASFGLSASTSVGSAVFWAVLAAG